MKSLNITRTIQKYGPGYIAKSKTTGRVIASAKRIDDLVKKTEKLTNVVISWVPKKNSRYVLPRISL